MQPRPAVSLPRLFGLSLALFIAGTAAGAGAHRYQVSWREISTQYTYDGRLDEGGSRTLKFDVKQDNVTSIEFALKWIETDDAVGLSKPDRFRLEATRPDGTPLDNSPAEGGEGYLRLGASRLNRVPPMTTLEAGSLPELSKALAPSRGGVGLGVWNIKVTLLSTGNAPHTDVDAGNAYVVTVTLKWYEPVVMRVVDLAPASDLSVASAVAGTPPLWLWTTGALGAVSLGLGVFLGVDAVRRRRRRPETDR